MKKVLSLILLTAIMCSCGENGAAPAPAPAAPKLTGTNPVNNAGELEGSALSIRLEFDQNVKCPDPSRITVNDPDAKISKVNAPSDYVTIDVTGLEAGKSYAVTVPYGTILGFKDGQDPVGKIEFNFSMKAAPEPDPEPEILDNNAYRIARWLGLGWNLGNQMDGYCNWECPEYNYPSETVWGNGKCTQATFDALKAAGFKSVRIPVTWLNYIGPAPDYMIDESWLSRVEEIVGYAEKTGLNAIINTHHDENNNDDHWLDIRSATADAGKNEAVKEKIRVFWTRLASRFKDRGDFLIFESFNEIQDGGWGWSTDFRADPSRQCNILNEWNQVFVDAVRATGGNNADRWLGVPGYAASADYLDYFRLPDDPAGKTMVAVHFYDPMDYAGGGKYTEWGHTAHADRKAGWGDEDNVTAKFSKLWQQFVSKDIPVYIGEYGCVNRANDNDRRYQFYYLEYVTRAAWFYGMPCFLWDNGAYQSSGENFGYIRHDDGSFIGEAKKAVQIMNKAAYTEDEGYNLETIYNTAP